MRLRVPEGVAKPLADLADEAFERMVTVMRGINHRYQGIQLNAATRIREEICGPLTQKVEHKHQLSDLTDEQLEAKWNALQERIAAQPEEDRRLGRVRG